jgi:plastocyanin
MVSIDKVAIVFSIAIALVGVGIAVVGGSVDYTPTTTPSVSTPVSEPQTSSDGFGAELAAKIRAEAENSVNADSLQDRQDAADKAAAAAEADKAAVQAAAAQAAAEAAADKAAAAQAAAVAAEAVAAAQATSDKAVVQAAAEAAAAEAAAEAAAVQAAEAAAAPKTVIVDIPTGTSSPGCETNDTCFSPAMVSINAGDTVEWANIDTAAHTVTGGSPADGLSGVFDSSLLMASANYAFTFDEAGSYDYFCMVHPWMVGSVSVN